MAFRDKLQKYKMGTGIQGASQEELQSLTQKAERPIAPSSPLESSVIGASPDQAKMAGTPAQKTSALRVAIQQEKSLPDAQRTAQARTQLTAEEQAAGQKGQKVQSLNSLNDRVQNLTKNMIQSAQAQTTASMQIDQSKLSAFPQESQQEAQALLAKLGSNQATNEDILRLNQLMGKTDIATQLTPEQIKANFMTAGQAAGQSLANATADQFNVADLDPTTLGFQDMNELATVLGIPPEELAGLNLKELQDSAQKLFQDEFNKVQTLETRANDINLGPAERAEARKELKDMGATGIRQSESGIDKLADQVANADTITFAGESLNVKDVLSDEYLSGLAAHYLDSDPNDPFKKELLESEPELAKWLDDNAEVLRQATQDLDEDVKTFSDLQFQNQKLKSSPDLPDLNDSVMQSIFPDWGQLRTEAYNIQEVPALQMMQDSNIPQQTRANVRNAFEQFNSSAPQLTAQLARLSPQQLDQLGATQGSGNTKWQAVTSYLKDTSNINSVDAQQPDTIAAFIMGPGKTFNDLLNSSQDTQARARSGLFGNSPFNEELTNILQTQDPSQIAEYLQEKFAKPENIANLINETPFSASQAGQAASNYNNQNSELFDITKKYFNQDSTLNDADIADIAKTSPANLEKVVNSQLKSKLSPAAQKQAQSTYEKYYSPEYSNKLTQANFYSLPSMYSLMNKKVGTLSQADVLKADGTLNQMISELKTINKSKNPMQYQFLSETINDLQKNLNAHYDKWKSDIMNIMQVGGDKDKIKEFKKMMDHAAPGTSTAVKEIMKAVGIDDEKAFEKAVAVMGKSGTGFIRSIQSLDIYGNLINEAARTLNKWTGGDTTKKAAETVGSVGNAIGDAVSGCFLKGELFILADGSLKKIEDITVYDSLLGGGKTFATAQFTSFEMYSYRGIIVAGSHAVLEGSTWKRVRDSEFATRTPWFDGSIVHVVWNEEHRMYHASGVIFSDYAETDSTSERINNMKNITELNNEY